MVLYHGNDSIQLDHFQFGAVAVANQRENIASVVRTRIKNSLYARPSHIVRLPISGGHSSPKLGSLISSIETPEAAPEGSRETDPQTLSCWSVRANSICPLCVA